MYEQRPPAVKPLLLTAGLHAARPPSSPLRDGTAAVPAACPGRRPGLQLRQPSLDRLATVATIPPERDSWNTSAAALLVDPARRHRQEFGDLVGGHEFARRHAADSAPGVRLLEPLDSRTGREEGRRSTGHRRRSQA